MLDHLLESSHRDDSNKWSNIGFGQEIKELASIEIIFTHVIWRSVIIEKDIDVMVLGSVERVAPVITVNETETASFNLLFLPEYIHAHY